jgi:hypothetical protein
VTYAAPLGWGVDQGVLIVRHVFGDGSTVLSFYGHLDPPSVVLLAGDCVARGDQVGQIGKPRTSPHLHFEIRTHMPYQPGPGYWSVDPTLAGWKPPSQFIWDYRMSTAPGVEWMRSFESDSTAAVGFLGTDTLVALDGERLIGVDLSGEGLRWSQPISLSYTSPAATISADGSTLYLANLLGEVEAFQLPAEQSTEDTPSLASKWKIEGATRGRPTLIPLPAGGVAVAAWGEMYGLSPEGRMLWVQDFNGRPFDWAPLGERLIFTLEGRHGPVWSIDRSGPIAWPAPIGGRLLIAGEWIYVYAADGIYHLDPETLSAELLLALPVGSPSSGDIVALPDGGLLVAHPDVYDRRLIALNGDGSVRWERSYSELLRGRQHLLVLDGRPFLVAENSASSSAGEISIFAIDLDSAELARIFMGGNRSSSPRAVSAFVVGDDRFLVNAGGGRLVMLHPLMALEAVSQTPGSQ